MTVESISFTPAVDGDLMVEIGEPFKAEAPLVRIHSECIFGEVLDSDLCDCADQFRIAMTKIHQEGTGLLIYLRLDGRGAGLAAKVKATALEIHGVDTYESRNTIGVPPEGRDFHAVGRFLATRGLKKIRLLTNNPIKATGLRDAGLEVNTIPLLVAEPSGNVRKLYHTKAIMFGHQIPKELS